MIIRKCDDYFLIKVFNVDIDCFNIFDIENIKVFIKNIFNKLRKKYELHGLFDVDVFVNDCYGIIVELKSIETYFDEVDMRIKIHFDYDFLVEIGSNSILDYEDVYYYEGKFYSFYSKDSDSEVFYKNTDEIINKGIKVI